MQRFRFHRDNDNGGRFVSQKSVAERADLSYGIRGQHTRFISDELPLARAPHIEFLSNDRQCGY